MQLLELGSNSAQGAQPVQTRLAWVSCTVKGADRSTDFPEKSRFRPPIFPAYFLIRVGAKRPGKSVAALLFKKRSVTQQGGSRASEHGAAKCAPLAGSGLGRGARVEGDPGCRKAKGAPGCASVATQL